jgi:hypothetical protein
MDLAMGHDVRRVVGGLVNPSRFRRALRQESRQVSVPHYSMTAPARRCELRLSIHGYEVCDLTLSALVTSADPLIEYKSISTPCVDIV